MKSGKPIEISKSSLISLKAELSRKQEEINKVKSSDVTYIKCPSKPKPTPKTNTGVEERNKQDLELTSEEVDLLKKSREVLEVKSRLYDKLQKGNLVSEDGKSRYLVDFDSKASSSTNEGASTQKEASPANSDHTISSSDGELDEDEWVEYTDCLGRLRKCHRSDLPQMLEQDRRVAREVRRERSPSPRPQASPPAPGPPLELMCSDMEREEARKRWELQEQELLNKKDIHYEDVLFEGEMYTSYRCIRVYQMLDF